MFNNLFIPLNIFKKSQQNRNIRGKRDAWLALFSSNDPEIIIKLVERYPEFHKIYEEGYEICLNVERVMEMFSKELYELDKNTVQYMIDEMQDTIDAQAGKINKMQEEQEKAIRGTIDMLRNMHMPESEIIEKICCLYGINKERARKYL